MGWAFIFESYPERKRVVKSKNIKAQPMCKFAQLKGLNMIYTSLTKALEHDMYFITYRA